MDPQTPKTNAMYKAHADYIAELEKDKARLDWMTGEGSQTITTITMQARKVAEIWKEDPKSTYREAIDQCRAMGLK